MGVMVSNVNTTVALKVINDICQIMLTLIFLHTPAIVGLDYAIQHIFGRERVQPKKFAVVDFKMIKLLLYSYVGIIPGLFVIFWRYRSNQFTIDWEFKISDIPYNLFAITILLLIYDAWYFWIHYLEHQIPFLWKYHKMHHIYTAPNVIVALIAHPFETLISHTPVWILFTFVPHLNIGLMVLWIVVIILPQVIDHCGYQNMDKWLFWKTTTVKYHDIHHSRFVYDYAILFQFWDRIMGTKYEA